VQQTDDVLELRTADAIQKQPFVLLRNYICRSKGSRGQFQLAQNLHTHNITRPTVEQIHMDQLPERGKSRTSHLIDREDSDRKNWRIQAVPGYLNFEGESAPKVDSDRIGKYQLSDKENPSLAAKNSEPRQKYC
jgi:hypothetical protein